MERDRLVLPGDDVTVEVLHAAASAGGTAPPPIKLSGGGFAVLTADTMAGGNGGGGEDADGDAAMAGGDAGSERYVVTKAGVLSFRAPARFVVLSSAKRYAAAVGDTVVGVVSDRNAEYYRVKLHGSSTALLPALAFDGATKRSKPNLAVGALVFARVAACSRFADPELSCAVGSAAAASAGVKRDWLSGESVYGELHGGTTVSVSTALARRLLRPDAAVLTALGGLLPFEIAVGMNGIVWLRAATVRGTVTAVNAVRRCEYLTESQCSTLVSKVAAILLEDESDARGAGARR